MKRLLSQIITTTVGLWVVTYFIPGVQVKVFPESNFFGISLAHQWQIFLLLGIVLGLLNFFVKPILNTVTLPLRIVTLGLFTIVVNIALIWVVDFIFKEFSAPFLWPLLGATVIILVLDLLISKLLIKKD